jgi:hypothetical protein
MIRSANGQVNLRSFIENAKYAELWEENLEPICDIIHQRSVVPKAIQYRIQRLSVDSSFRLSFPIRDQGADIKSWIIRLEERFKDEKSGTWEEIPLITTRGAGLPIPEQPLTKRPRDS